MPRRRFRSLAAITVLAVAAGTGCNYLAVKGAVGRYQIEFEDTGEADKATAQYFSVRLEKSPEKPEDRFVGGIDSEIQLAHSDFFDEGGGGIEPLAFDIVPYFGVSPRLGRFFRLPMRLGPLFHYFKLEASPSNSVWLSFGGKGWISPELVLLRSTLVSEELTLFGEAMGMAGGSNIETSVDDEIEARDNTFFNSSLLGYGYEGGVKYRYKVFELRGSWFFRRMITEERDEEFGPVVSALDNDFTGVAITLGFHF